MQFDAYCFGDSESAGCRFPVYDGRIIHQLNHLRFTIMNLGVVLMDGACVAMTLHSMFECRGSEANIVDVAALASVVGTFKVIHYIGLFLVGFLWRRTISHKERSSQVWLAVGPYDDLLVRFYRSCTPLYTPTDCVTFIFIFGSKGDAVEQDNRCP